MRPAFSRPRYAVFFALLLAVLLAAPWAVARLGILDRATAYPVLPVGAGPAAHIQTEIFEESGPIDIVFIGSSLMWSGIDAPWLQDALSRALGRPAVVRVIATVWPGLDRDYWLLRDLLEQREVGLAVIQFPNRNRPTRDGAAEVNRVADQPHVRAYGYYREGEFPEIYEGFGFRYRVALYAEAVLGMPRHLLSMVRPNEISPSPVAETLGARLQKLGLYGAPFVEFTPDSPVFPASEMIYSQNAASDYRFFDEPLPPYQIHFANLIAATLAEHETPAVLLHIPQENEIDAEFVEERVNWLDTFDIDAEMVGVPPERLFEGYTLDEARRFFSSDHLNENGAIYFTRAIAPALIEIYAANEED